MLRALGKFEAATAYSDEMAVFNVLGVFFLKNLPPEVDIRRALDTLQKRQPLLGVRLVSSNGRYVFEGGEIPLISLASWPRGGDASWIRVAEERLNANIDRQRGPLLLCDYITENGVDGEIILTAHHSIADSASLRALFGQLMELCRQYDAQEEPQEAARQPALPPVETAYPPAYQGLALTPKIAGYLFREISQEMSFQLKMRGGPRHAIFPDARLKILAARLSAKETKAIVRRSRQERVTLFSVVHAAMLLGVQKHLYDGQALPFRYIAPTDLRPYVEPPPSPTDLGCYISMLRFTLPLQGGEDLWDVARRVNEQIYRASKRGDKYLAALLTKQVLQMVFRQHTTRMATTAVTFSGPTLLSPAYGPFQVNGWRGFVSNFGHGPEFVAHLSISQDELWVDFMYLDADMGSEKAQQLADEVLSILVNGSHA